MNEVEIHVRDYANAYVTCTRGGVRASSTMSAEEAACAFGRKYFGSGFKEAVQSGQVSTGHTLWKVRGTASRGSKR